jgi:Domain of unknown function (DUF4111)
VAVENQPLTLLVTMALEGETLVGPPPSEVFDPIPRADFVEALVAGIDGLVAALDSDTRNVVLTLARIWNGVATLGIHSKEEAAEWALPRLAPAHRAVLVRARDIYLGSEQEHWEDVRDGLHPFVAAVIAEIEAARSAWLSRS